MEIDLHGFELWDAIDEILYKLEECKIKGERELLLVHGYKSGQVLKNYLRSKRFLTEMAQEGYNLKMKEILNSGMTSFEIFYKKSNIRWYNVKNSEL